MIYKSQALNFTTNGANGLNLALGTAGNYPASSWIGFNESSSAFGGGGTDGMAGLELTKETYEGATIVQWNGNEKIDGAIVGPFISVKTLIPNGYQVGKTYTISVWLKADYAASFNFDYLVEDHLLGLISTSGGQEITTAWQRFSATFVAQKEVSNICFYTGKGATEGAAKVYMCGIKIEEGSFATPWCPAIEDQLVANINNDFSWKFSPTEGMYMWNGEQGDGSNSDPNLVFKVWENPSSPKDNKKELYVKGHIEATSGNISGVNMDNLAGTEEGLRKNLVAKEDIENINVTINSTTGFLWNVTKTGTYGGLKLTSSLFEIGRQYILSYRIQQTEGELVNIAGHSDGFTLKKQYINNIPFDFNPSIFSAHYGVNKTNLQTLGSLDQEFYVVVVLEFHGNSGEGNNNLYIQPNRNTDTPITYNVWNIKLEKIEDGEEALPTNWSPSPRDLFSWKFSSTEGMYMWNGPQTEVPLLNINRQGLSLQTGDIHVGNGTISAKITPQDGSTFGPFVQSLEGENRIIKSFEGGVQLSADTIKTPAIKYSAGEASLQFGTYGVQTDVVQLMIESSLENNIFTITCSLEKDGKSYKACEDIVIAVSILYRYADFITYDETENYTFTITKNYSSGTITDIPRYKTFKAFLVDQTFTVSALSCGIVENINNTAVTERVAYAGSTKKKKFTDLAQTGNASPAMYCNGDLIPTIHSSDGGTSTTVKHGYDLGADQKRWNGIYLRTSPNVGSDRNIKKNIIPLSDNYDTIFDNLIPVSYQLIVNESNRHHSGFIAQDVKAAIEQAEMTTQQFAGYCEWKKEDGTIGCSLRYEEFIPLNTWQIQKLKPRMASAEEKLLAYESRISALEKEIENLKKS